MVVERAASAAKLLISLTCRVKLLQIAPEVADLALLDAPERHPGAWNLGLRICDGGLEGSLVPGNGVFFVASLAASAVGCGFEDRGCAYLSFLS